jgi:hypothetical protein
LQFFIFLQYTFDITVVPCCMNSTISMPFLSCPRKEFPSAMWQTFVKLLRLGQCAHPQLWLLLGFNSCKWRRCHHLLLIQCDWEIHCHLCGISLKVKTKAILCISCAPMSIFGAHLSKNFC